MKFAALIFLTLLGAGKSFAGTVSFSKDFIAATLQSVGKEPGERVNIELYETFSNIIYNRDGINASPRFKISFIRPERSPVGSNVALEPDELVVVWEGVCEYGAKVFKGKMVSSEYFRVYIDRNGRVAIHGDGTVVGECN